MIVQLCPLLRRKADICLPCFILVTIFTFVDDILPIYKKKLLRTLPVNLTCMPTYLKGLCYCFEKIIAYNEIHTRFFKWHWLSQNVKQNPKLYISCSCRYSLLKLQIVLFPRNKMIILRTIHRWRTKLSKKAYRMLAYPILHQRSGRWKQGLRNCYSQHEFPPPTEWH